MQFYFVPEILIELLALVNKLVHNQFALTLVARFISEIFYFNFYFKSQLENFIRKSRETFNMLPRALQRQLRADVY